jgi:hypothetical protein
VLSRVETKERDMRLLKRDAIATGMVAVTGLLYGLWAVNSAPWGMSSIRVTGAVILALGFVASASAVVPSFDQLIRGDRIYLAVASLIGLVAFAGGLWTLIYASETGLGLLVGAMGVLWLISTVHHSLLARRARNARPNEAVVTPHIRSTRRPGAERKEAA